MTARLLVRWLELCALAASVWSLSPSPLAGIRVNNKPALLVVALFATTPENSSEEKNDSNTNRNSDSIEWGVSYIGGDPCSSKYNDDPFDKQVQKPGMPDSMKARIQAMVDERRENEAAEQLNGEV